MLNCKRGTRCFEMHSGNRWCIPSSRRTVYILIHSRSSRSGSTILLSVGPSDGGKTTIFSSVAGDSAAVETRVIRSIFARWRVPAILAKDCFVGEELMIGWQRDRECVPRLITRGLQVSVGTVARTSWMVVESKLQGWVAQRGQGLRIELDDPISLPAVSPAASLGDVTPARSGSSSEIRTSSSIKPAIGATNERSQRRRLQI